MYFLSKTIQNIITTTCSLKLRKKKKDDYLSAVNMPCVRIHTFNALLLIDRFHDVIQFSNFKIYLKSSAAEPHNFEIYLLYIRDSLVIKTSKRKKN